MRTHLTYILATLSTLEYAASRFSPEISMSPAKRSAFLNCRGPSSNQYHQPVGIIYTWTLGAMFTVPHCLQASRSILAPLLAMPHIRKKKKDIQTVLSLMVIVFKRLFEKEKKSSRFATALGIGNGTICTVSSQMVYNFYKILFQTFQNFLFNVH